MKLESIAKFAGNIVTFAALPALIFFNFSAFLFFLNEWRTPLIWGSVIIFIFSFIYYIRERAYPEKSMCFLLLLLFGATGSAAFYDPYPPASLVSISGFYNEKDGSWVSSNTDENTHDIIQKMEESWARATSRENPSFRFARPFAIYNWQFPTLFLTHRSKQQIINMVEDNTRSAVTLVGFTRDDKLNALHYSLNEKVLEPNMHKVVHENAWFNKLFAKIIDHPELIDSQKREIIAKILFIEFNARALSARADEMDVFGMASLVDKTQDEVVSLQKKYDFIKDELNYLMAGLTASFIDVYGDTLPEETAADFLIEALSYYPYYPYPDKENFQRAYTKMSYASWKLSQDSDDDITLLNHLAQMTYDIEDSQVKERIIKSFKDRVFMPHESAVMFYYMLDMTKTARPLLEIPAQQMNEVIELEKYTDKFLQHHPGMDNEFIELKSALLYGVYHTWYKNNHREKDAAKFLAKFEGILDNNESIRFFLIRMQEENSKAQ